MTRKIIIGIHDFGRPKTEEFAYLRHWLATYSDYEFDAPILYEETNEDADWYVWLAKAKNFVQGYLDEGYEVTLCGISMGGVIAAFLGATMPIQKLILVAPSYLYLDFEASWRLVKKVVTLLDDEACFEKYLNERILSPEYYQEYMEMVQSLKAALEQITCPTLILHGTQDEYVPLLSSRYAYSRLKNEKKHLLFVEGGGHDLLEGSQAQTAVNLIKIFLADWI